MTTPSETALSAEEVRREIEAIKACPHCGGESDHDRGRIVVLHWVADRLEADAARSQPATEGLREALDAVAKERDRQDRKWGQQNHDATVWLAVLTEEVGELADAALARRALLADGYSIGPAIEAMRNEAVQVAAVAVAVIEWMDRGAPVHENAAAETAAVEIEHHKARAALAATESAGDERT